MYGSIPRLPTAMPNISNQVEFSIPPAEDRLLQFDEIDIWLQPDLGNSRQVGSTLKVASRKGGHFAKATAPEFSLGTGLVESLETINISGGITESNTLPLFIPNYKPDGSFFIAMIIHWDANISTTGVVYQLFNAGIQGDQDLECYMLNNALYVRFSTAESGSIVDYQNATSGSKFVPGESCLLWVGYDAETGVVDYGINSAEPQAWASEDINASVDFPVLSRDLVIGGKFNPAGTSGTQLFHGSIRAFFAGKMNWVSEDKQLIRTAFISELASLYVSDFTLS